MSESWSLPRRGRKRKRNQEPNAMLIDILRCLFYKIVNAYHSRSKDCDSVASQKQPLV